MRVIFITDSYYPSPSPNAICVEKLKNVCDQRKITTEIVAIRTFAKDTEFFSDSSIHFVKPDFLYTALIDAKATNNIKRFNLICKLFRVRGVINGFFWPLMSVSHILKYTIAVVKILKRNEDETIVIGVYKSLEGAVSGAIVKKIWGRAIYVLYTLDAISGSIIPKVLRSQSISNKSIKRWEYFLFNTYDLLFLMESHKSYYDSNQYSLYRNKIHYVDIPLFYAREPKDPINDGKVHFVFTGGISKNTANPTFFLQILDYLNDKEIVFDIYGKIFDRDIEMKIKSSQYTQYHGLVSHDEILKIQSSSNVLLNFGNFTPCAIPCKIFEYFSTGKPIVSFIKIDNDASIPYITKYPNSLIIDERNSIEESALSVKTFIETPYLPCIKDLKSIFFENTPDATIDRILIYKDNG